MASEKKVQNQIPCMILCAGTSKRFGGNKMLADLAGKPLLAHTIERLRPQVSDLAINGNDAEYGGFGLPVFPDVISGKLGPLAGILTAMEWAAELGYARVLTVSGDTPFIPYCLVESLANVRSKGIVTPQVGDQHHQVCGLWPVSEAPNLRSFLQDGHSYKVRSFLATYETMVFLFPEENGIDPFFNVNTRKDMEKAALILTARD